MLVYIPFDVAASQIGSYCVCNILKLFVPLSQKNESGKVMNQVFKVCILCIILTLMTENLLEVACCGTDLCFS